MQGQWIFDGGEKPLRHTSDITLTFTPHSRRLGMSPGLKRERETPQLLEEESMEEVVSGTQAWFACHHKPQRRE